MKALTKAIVFCVFFCVFLSGFLFSVIPPQQAQVVQRQNFGDDKLVAEVDLAAEEKLKREREENERLKPKGGIDTVLILDIKIKNPADGYN